MQGAIHPFSAWRGLSLQLLLPRKVLLPPDSETKWMRETQPLLLTLGPCAGKESHSQKNQEMPEPMSRKHGWRVNFWPLLQESSLFLLSVKYIKRLQDRIQIFFLAGNLNNSTSSCFPFQFCHRKVQCSPAPLGNVRTVLLSSKRVHLHYTPWLTQSKSWLTLTITTLD